MIVTGQVGRQGHVVMRIGIECDCLQQEPQEIREARLSKVVLLYCPESNVPHVGSLMRSGNYMDVRGVGTRKLTINAFVTDKCVNHQDSCSCSAIFNHLLQTYGGTLVQVISLNFNAFAGMGYLKRFDGCR